MKMSRFAFYFCMATFFLSACTPSQAAIQSAVQETQGAWTPIPSQTPYPTNTPYPTYTQQPTVQITKIVTPTFTNSPIFTPTITSTPTKTGTPTPTVNPLTTPRGDGFYLVGVDIAPGVWRSQGTGDRCYWEIDTRTGDIISNHFGMAGGTMYIPSTAFQVSVEDCGSWIYLGP